MSTETGRAGKSGDRAGRPRRGVLALAAVLLLASETIWAAEPHRVEAVGVYPIRETVRGTSNPRDEAIQKALWEGVSRVALELIGEEVEPEAPEADEGMPGTGADPAKGGAPVDPTARFRKILGSQILPYTRSFRIVEDRGERPVLFADEPGVRSEHLVVVEVLVDVDRLTAELARAGLVERPDTGSGPRQLVTIELIGLERHAGLRRVLEALRQEIGATRIETLEFAPARQLLRVEAPFGPDEIAARLGRVESADLILDPVEVDREGRRLRVLAQWFPPAPADEEAPNGAGSSASAAPPR